MKQETLLRYKGFNSTPILWKSSFPFTFSQLDLNLNNSIIDSSIFTQNIRLGKLVEEFAFAQLKQHSDIRWIDENIQIKDDKTTIGEIDALFYLKDKPIHLEIAYKFYLLDNIKSYNQPLSYWLGPNRKDSLEYKLNKLEQKQFPLLYNPSAKAYLKKYGLAAKDLSQMVFFKAQLFLPYNNKGISIIPLNSECVSGYYCSYSNFKKFISLKFYIPNKLDWLIIPHNDVDWLDYEQAQIIVEKHISQKRSPMVWMRYNKRKIHKCFITWW